DRPPDGLVVRAVQGQRRRRAVVLHHALPGEGVLGARGLPGASGVAAVALAAVLLGVAPLGADDWTPLDAARWAHLTGSLRADYFSSSRSLDDREHLFGSAFYLKASPRFGGHVSGVFEGWVRRPDLFDAHTTDGDLREGYLDLTLGKMDLRVGK